MENPQTKQYHLPFDQDREHLKMHILTYMKSKSYPINIQTLDLMALSLADFVAASIEKFARGQQEHGGNLQTRDLDMELRMELIDIFWYSMAKTWPK